MQHFSPLQYLKIDVASAFGLDRADWSERLSWFDTNENQLDTLVQQSKEPALFFAAVEAYKKTMQGHPTGHMVSLDATASGIQILSCLAGDISAARHCNVINTGHRQDAYTNVYQFMQDVTPFDAIDRKDAKFALMTVFYGSDAVPKQVFGEGALLDLFETIAEREMPGVWALNKAMLRMWNPEALSYEWIMPDNFHVKTKVMGSALTRVKFAGQTVDAYTRVNAAQPEGRSIGANLVHSIDGYFVREMVRRNSHDRGQVADVSAALHTGRGYGSNRPQDKMLTRLSDLHRASGMLSARVFDYIDKHNVDLIDRVAVRQLIDSLPAKPYSILANHDCFRVHPNYADPMRQQYNCQLAELAQSNCLNFLCSQILDKPVNTQKMAVLDFNEILSADYALS